MIEVPLKGTMEFFFNEGSLPGSVRNIGGGGVDFGLPRFLRPPCRKCDKFQARLSAVLA